jgi:hypothetical protein
MSRMLSLLLLAGSVFAQQVPRPAQDLVFLKDGGQVRLGQYKGKVVAVFFLFTT